MGNVSFNSDKVNLLAAELLDKLGKAVEKDGFSPTEVVLALAITQQTYLETHKVVCKAKGLIPRE